MPFGCMSMARLGAKYAEGSWVQVYGYFWVHVYTFCHIQEDLVRFMSCGVMQQQKHLNQQAQLQMGDLGGHPHEKMRSSLRNQAQSIQMHRQIR